MYTQRRRDDEERKPVFNIEAWEPKTDLGRKVKAREITSLEEIFHESKRIEEPEIVEALLPNLKSDVIEITSVQRMTKNNRKQKFKVVAVVGDQMGHVGIGSGKNVEVKAAIDSAIVDAKRNVIPVLFGCGSWQCRCGTNHSIPLTVKGKCGSVEVILKPAPRGIGVVASKPVKKMLELSGLKDVWSFSKGRTRSRYNSIAAAYRALQNTARMKNLEVLNLVAEK